MLRALVFCILTILPAQVRADVALIMFEEPGCFWCAQWNADVSPEYAKTTEGQIAPLRRLQLNDDLPSDVTLERPAVYTPTFVLVRDGHELGRIEGYPGEDFFWGLLGIMLRDNALWPQDGETQG